MLPHLQVDAKAKSVCIRLESHIASPNPGTSNPASLLSPEAQNQFLDQCSQQADWQPVPLAGSRSQPLFSLVQQIRTEQSPDLSLAGHSSLQIYCL